MFKLFVSLFMMFGLLYGASIAVADEATVVQPVVEAAGVAAESTPGGLIDSLLSGLLDRIPAKTILWVLAIISLLNALSVGLEKLVEMTPTDKDNLALDKIKKILAYVKKAVDFVIARRSGVVTPAPVQEQDKV